MEMHSFSFKKLHVKMLSVKRRPFCLSLNVLSIRGSGRLVHIRKLFCNISELVIFSLPKYKPAIQISHISCWLSTHLAISEDLIGLVTLHWTRTRSKWLPWGLETWPPEPVTRDNQKAIYYQGLISRNRWSIYQQNNWNCHQLLLCTRHQYSVNHQCGLQNYLRCICWYKYYTQDFYEIKMPLSKYVAVHSIKLF